MSAKLGAGRVRKAYKFIETSRKRFSVQEICRVPENAPWGYSERLKKPLSNCAKEDIRVLRLIRACFKTSRGTHGAPRVFLDLREARAIFSKRRVARLMQENGLRHCTAIERGGYRSANRPC
jgi:hypothetical protein